MAILQQRGKSDPNPVLPLSVGSPQMPVFIGGETCIWKHRVCFSYCLQCWEINKKKSGFYLLTEQFWFENHWQTSNMGPHHEMFTVPFQRGTPLWNEVKVCGKFAERGMRRGRKLKHDGAISSQGLGKKPDIRIPHVSSPLTRWSLPVVVIGLAFVLISLYFRFASFALLSFITSTSKLCSSAPFLVKETKKMISFCFDSVFLVRTRATCFL